LLAFALAGLAFVAAPHFREKPPALVTLQIPAPEKGALDESRPPAISPNGRRIAFLANVDGRRMVWVRDLNSLDVRMVPGTQNSTTFFWSPDSRQLAFVSDGKLMKIDAAGGPATTIFSGPTGPFGGAWNQDGVILFVKERHLFRISAAGGTPSPVTEFDNRRDEVVHAGPEFLPDGRHFLYLAGSARLDFALFVGDLQSKEKKLLVQPLDSHGLYVDPGYLLFVRDHVLMAQPFDAGKLQTTGDAVAVVEGVDTSGRVRYVSASPNGTLAYASGGPSERLQLTWYDRSGKAVGTIGKPVVILTLRLSPDGKILASDRPDAQNKNRDIWLTDLARGSEQRLTFDGENSSPVWSPDGLRLAFLYRESGFDFKVSVKSVDGTGRDVVLESARKLPSDWTRDGRYLISFTPNFHPKTGADLWALPLSEGKAAGQPVPLRETEFNECYGRVSPDGRWLAYESNDTRRNEVYVVGFPSLNGHWHVSVDGGRYPVWSRDGRELYFVGANNKMMAVEIKPGPQFEAGVPKPLFDVPLGSGNPSYDVSADSRFLIATPVEQSGAAPMTVVLNWQAALKK
jgi:Tol biopolymer transport system component